MTRPRLLDLFAGAGGAAMGYHRAGFDVVGVDIAPQPRYPFKFYRRDWREALDDFDLADFAAIHASPPCQDHSSTKDLGGRHGTGWMLGAARRRLAAEGVPYVIENVRGAPLAHQDDLFGTNGLELCGCMFPATRGLLYEARWFETSFAVPQPPHRLHKWPQTKMGRPPKPGECMQITGHFSDVAEGQRRMGIDWMTQTELAQAIPSAYSEYLGRHLLAAIQEAA
jgi:DNA (cytosine-5)-methyltransferase 1